MSATLHNIQVQLCSASLTEKLETVDPVPTFELLSWNMHSSSLGVAWISSDRFTVRTQKKSDLLVPPKTKKVNNKKRIHGSRPASIVLETLWPCRKVPEISKKLAVGHGRIALLVQSKDLHVAQDNELLFPGMFRAPLLWRGPRHSNPS